MNGRLPSRPTFMGAVQVLDKPSIFHQFPLSCEIVENTRIKRSKIVAAKGYLRTTEGVCKLKDCFNVDPENSPFHVQVTKSLFFLTKLMII